VPVDNHGDKPEHEDEDSDEGPNDEGPIRGDRYHARFHSNLC